MARARNIKPSFFKNEDLAECSPLARLLFIYLWTEADKEGRLEDRPKQIKAYGLPYDTCDADALLDELQKYNFIKRYEGKGKKVIWIVNFTKHQNPHPKENPSELAEYCEAVEKNFLPRQEMASSAYSPIPLPESPIPHPPSPSGAECFSEFWEAWPKSDRKTDKQKCIDKWKRYGLDGKIEEVLQALDAWKGCNDWRKNNGAYIPAPLVWLNGRRWETAPAARVEVEYNPEESAF